MLIAFSGIDGAGKSTQIKLLKNTFASEKKKVKVIWARGGYTPLLQGAKDLIRRIGSNSIPKPGKSIARQKKFDNPRFRKIWLLAAIIDLIILYCFYVRYLELIGYSVIFDRYAEDTALDFKHNFPEEDVTSWWLWRFLLKTKPIPFKHFVLLIPLEESQKRSILKNEPFPDSQEVLRFRLGEYEKLLKQSNRFIRLDCNRTINEIAEDINKDVFTKTEVNVFQ